jgi:xanthine permease XanP
MSQKPSGGAAPNLLYGLQDRPPFFPSMLAAIQHILACLVAIVTPTLIIGSALGLGELTPYLVSMSLIASGVGTYVQARRIGPVGSGLLSVQGTSFSFVGAITAAGLVAENRGDSPEQMLALIFGLCLAGSVIEMGVSQFIEKLKRIITPTVTGIVIMVIGLSLLEVAFTDLIGSVGAKDAGSPINLGVGLLVVVVIVALSFHKSAFVRLSAILLGLLVGSAVAAFFGMFDISALGTQALITVPIPLRFGLSFDFALFLPIAFIYLITAIETAGDLTATSIISGQPVQGEIYIRRIRAGILGDSLNSTVAALLNAFPSTTFSQNNGVIQLTGVASRHVGLYIAAILVVLGLFPVVGGAFTILPKPVIGGAMLILFGSITVAGIRIIASSPITRKAIYVMALSFGFGLGVALVPEAISGLPDFLQKTIGSPIIVAGLVAIFTTLVLPEDEPISDADKAVAE